MITSCVKNKRYHKKIGTSATFLATQTDYWVSKWKQLNERSIAHNKF